MEDQAPQTELEALIGLYRQGRYGAVVEHGKRLVERHPHDATLHNLIGAAHSGLKDYGQAVIAYWRAIGSDRGRGDILSNLGVALRHLGRTGEAIAALERAIRLRPGDAGAHCNLGNVLRDAGRPADAIASFQRAATIRPDLVEAHYNLANMFVEAGDPAAAVASYERALAIRPDYDAARAHKIYQQAHICAWDALMAERPAIAELGLDGPSISPFTLLALEDCPERHRIRAERYVADVFGPPARRTFTRPEARPKRIRIGYFSADFHDHATMHLLASLFEHHDRTRFEIHAYSYGPDRDDPWRRRLLATVDAFHGVRALSDHQIADKAAADGIDIAVDLKGLTHGSRLGIFAHGAAPIQVSFLGYPGPLAAPFIDYVVADPIVIPSGQRRHYPEKLLLLPDSYFPTDDVRAMPESATRADAGLPDEGFVFCCFNNSYKIGPAEFDIWMRLLGQIEGSVLWLIRTSPAAIANLRAQAVRRGISPDRLIFADALPLDGHLARLGCADLFLDTFHYNAHTTAIDALSTGVPVLTFPGASLAARVGASLLTALGLPELIAASADDYAAKALDLARDARKRVRLRKKLARHLKNHPLFDTARFTANLERGYDRLHEQRVNGAPEGDIDLR